MPDDFEVKPRIPSEKENQSDDPRLTRFGPDINQSDKQNAESEYMMPNMDASGPKRWSCLGCLGILLLLIGLGLAFFLWILPAIR